MIIILTLVFSIFSQKIVAEKERTIVENTYEEQITSNLNKILDKDMFSVSVSVDFNANTETINKYYEEADEALPGLTIKNPSNENTTNNNLVSMVSKISVTVIIDESVEDSKKSLIEGIVNNKIKLDKNRGDTLVIEKSKIPVQKVKDDQVSSLLKNKSFLIIVSVAFIFIIMLILTLWQLSLVKTELKSRAKLNADIEVDTKTNYPSEQGLAQTFSSQAVGTPVINSTDGIEDTEIKKSKTKKRSISDYRDKILTLGVTDPKACSSAMRKLISSQDGIMRAAVLVEELGYDYAKKIFAGINDSKWSELGKYIKDNIGDFNPNSAIDIIAEAYHMILGESIGSNSASNTGTSQFDMLASLSESELKKLIDNETNTSIALIASYYDSEQMVDIVKLLPETRQKEVVLEIARFENLPKELVSKAASALSVKLKKLHDPNTIEFKGSQYIGNLLNYIDQEQEEKILNYIEEADPKLRNNLRKYHFSFEDVKLIPNEYLEPALEEFDTKVLAKALNKASSELIYKINSAIPEKKSLMLNDELSIEQLISKKDILSCRHKLLAAIKSSLNKFDFDFNTLVKDTNTENSTTSEAYEEVSEETYDNTNTSTKDFSIDEPISNEDDIKKAS